jgi:hypothetical protein
MFTRKEILLPKLRFVVLMVILSSIYTQAVAEQQDSKKEDYPVISIEKLINLNPAKFTWKESILFETSESITVLIQEDIRETGYQSIPELLQTAPEVNIVKTESNNPAIITGGFNSPYAETLAGGTAYIPFSSDAHMNALDLMLDDIHQIDAMQKPEETLWIANVVGGLLWQVNKNMDISIVGQDLLDGLRPEFGNDNITATEPKRAIFVKLTWRF